MRKIVLKLLTQDTSNQDGIALKRMKAALSAQYLKKSDRTLNFDEIALG
ncbi:hypothetical protein [Legionella israelensis]|nr:hypothetical protein [Legionella israelensis]